MKLYKPEVCNAELSFFLAFSQQSTALVIQADGGLSKVGVKQHCPYQTEGKAVLFPIYLHGCIFPLYVKLQGIQTYFCFLYVADLPMYILYNVEIQHQ